MHIRCIVALAHLFDYDCFLPLPTNDHLNIYIRSSDCSWLIVPNNVPSDWYTVISITAFNLSDVGDSLTVYDGITQKAYCIFINHMVQALPHQLQ